MKQQISESERKLSHTSGCQTYQSNELLDLMKPQGKNLVMTPLRWSDCQVVQANAKEVFY